MKFKKAQTIVAEAAPHDYYQSVYRAMEKMYLPAVFKRLAKLPPGRVLEIGPGWGTTAIWLSERGHEVTVMDLMPIGSFLTRELCDRYGLTYIQHDIEDAPEPEGLRLDPFDVVVMTQVIHHLSWRPDRAMEHVHRLLSSSGILLASVLDRDHYPTLDSAYGHDWKNVPEWRQAPRSDDVIKCMYDAPMFTSLLKEHFNEVTIRRPRRSTVLFARAKI
ncbi:MAG: methyltransferase domain-containing protein [Acidimicrobiia bacterium]|nr:methyltransferase domain-containing protein [Acidimicrobiia bacterium]